MDKHLAQSYKFQEQGVLGRNLASSGVFIRDRKNLNARLVYGVGYALFIAMFLSRISFSQALLPVDYLYDSNGNLNHDVNKGISNIHYNFLNLADTITFSDGRKIVYTYTASGEKLRQQILDAAGSLKQKRDYSGNTLYNNDTLLQIHLQDGRLVPLLPGSSLENHVYQYHLKDHLGNARLSFTSRRDTLTYQATMESEKSEVENKLFQNLKINVVNAAANHTPRGNRAVFLPANNKTGPSLSLAVNKGDIIQMQVYAYYEKSTKDNPEIIASLIMQGLLNPLSGAKGAEMLIGKNSGMAGIETLALPGSDESTPEAYLNYQLLDKSYKAIDGGFRKVTKTANFGQEELSFRSIQIKQSGYLYVYLSNTSKDDQGVYFDDLKVTHIPIPIIQEDSYYPFGMPIAEEHDRRAGEIANRYLFNSKEMQDDLELNCYDFGARMYDPALGRFLKPDNFSEKYANYSPYQMTLNNPIKFVDINGDSIWIVNDQKQALLYENGNLYSVKNKVKSPYTGPDAQRNAQGEMVYSGFLGEAVKALGELSRSAKASRINSQLSSSTKNYIVLATKHSNMTIKDGIYEGRKGDIVLWNPSITSGPIDEDGNDAVPNYITLAHELYGHGTQASSLGSMGEHDGLELDEWWASTIENNIRDELGLPLRAYYGIQKNSIGQSVPDGPALIKHDGLMWRNSITGTPYYNNFTKKIMPMIMRF